MLASIIIFIIGVIIYAMFSAVFFYHLNKYQTAGDACKPMMAIYTILSISIIFAVFISFVYSYFKGI